jgi:cyclopropane-fatty-acyl-phospholipid synthase
VTIVERSGHTSRHSLTEALLKRLAGSISSGAIDVELPSGRQITLGNPAGARSRMKVHSWNTLSRILFSWDIGLAEAYMAGECSSPDLVALLRTLCLSEGPAGEPRTPELLAPLAKLRHWLNRNSRSGSRRNIAAHYDLGNGFYAPWLDSEMIYSSAIYEDPSESLEDAQRRKFSRIGELLDASPNQSILEIGCGWGSLARYLAQEKSCSVTALTLSREQLAHAIEADTTGRCEYRLQDYRDTSGSFDRIVSIEMLEAVGESYWPDYFKVLRDRLAPDGIAVIQTISIAEERFESYRRRPDFIQRYIFPGGMLPTSSVLAHEAYHAGLQLVHSERFGDSYGRTLADWTQRFQNAWPEIEKLGFDLRFKRMWEYYLAYCQAGFESGAIDVGLYKFVQGR